jgi:serine/threonine protein kinase/Tfp pilus assembly protein PilF
MSFADEAVSIPADSILEDLVAEITDRLQAGDPVELAGYLARYPEYAEELRRLLPALEMMAELGSATGPVAARARPATPSPLNDLGILGDFRLVGELGRGGMGIVYEAEQISLGRRVALKLLPMAAAMDPRQIQRFRIEAQAAACLHHPHIVPVHGVGVERGVHYYAMQLIEGQSLAAMIAGLRRLDGLDPPDGPAVDLSAIATTDLAARLLSGGAAGPPGAAGSDSPTASLPASASPPRAATPRAAPAGRTASSGSSTRNREYVRNVARLALQAAEALDHAHARGILHRDIKPANLLLDDEGRLWVTDFGLAQVRGDDRLTLSGDVLGTLRYMSPEQALGQRVVIDGRTDVYSLGVTLYELLTLRPAIDGRDRAEILRRIADGEPPPLRKVNPASPADLETIVLKATAKDPTSRYATAQELAEDLRSLLADRPIRARRPGLLDRAAKWSRRHRSVVLTAALLLVLGTLGTSLGLVWALRAERKATREKDRAMAAEAKAKEEKERATAAEAQAKEEAAVATAVRDFLTNDLLAEASPQKNPRSKKVTVEEVLGRAAARIAGKFSQRPRIEAEIRLTIGAAYVDLGDLTAAQPHLERAWEIVRRVLGEEGDGTYRFENRLAGLYFRQGKLVQAESLVVKALEVQRRVKGGEHDSTLNAMANLAVVYQGQTKWPEAERLLVEALEVRRRVLGEEDPGTLTFMRNLASVYLDQGKLAQAEPLVVKALEGHRRVLGEEHPETLSTMTKLARLYQAQGNSARAEPLLVEELEVRRRVLGEEHPETLEIMRGLAHMYEAQGKMAQAESLLAEALEVGRRVLGEEHSDTLSAMNNLGKLYNVQGKLAQAEPLLVRAREIARRTRGETHPDTFATANNLALWYWRNSKLDLSVPLLEDVLKGRRDKLGPDHPDTLLSMVNLGVNYKDAGRLQEGIALLEQAWALARKRPGPLAEPLESIPGALAETYDQAGRFAESEPLYRETLEAERRHHGEPSAKVAATMASLALHLLKQQKYAEAEPIVQECLRIHEQVAPDDWTTFNTRSLLGGSLLGQEKYAEAEPMLQSGYEGMKRREATIPPVGKIRLTEAIERLVQLYEATGEPGKAAVWRARLGRASLPADVFARP